MNIHHRNLRRVVIIGGGFGGLEAAKALRKASVRMTLLDRQNHHLFQPLLYQVATAALSPADIAEPLRHILRKQENVEVILSEVKSVDTARQARRDRGWSVRLRLSHRRGGRAPFLLRARRMGEGGSGPQEPG